MALVASPYGFRPVNMLGGQYMSHGMRHIKIASGYATSIFNGDLVKLVVGGTIEKDTGTVATTPIGVFVGLEIEDAAMGLNFRNMWVGGSIPKTGTTAWAYVIDDPDMLFEIQADGAVGQNGIGTNAAIVQGAGVVASGKSGVSLNSATLAVTATLPVRIVDHVRRAGSVLGDAKTDLIVRLNTHAHRTALGIAPA